MKLKLKEDPREWRKAAWQGLLGLAMLSCVLRWRGVLQAPAWGLILGSLAVLAAMAAVRPGWFRRYCRFSAKMGSRLGQAAGWVVLFTVFFIVVTPLGLVVRMLGNDLLGLRRSGSGKSYWLDSKRKTSLDRMY